MISLFRLFQLIGALLKSRVILYALQARWHKSISQETLGQAWADFFIQSGPIFIKLGQLLSTRQELFSAEFLAPLAALQEDVPPFDGERAKAIIESSFSESIDTIFSSFQVAAIASASIAQVHIGVLKNGKKVVAKILRPEAKTQIRADLRWMKALGRISQCIPSLRALNAPCIIREFEKMLEKETNLLMEAGAMAQAKRDNHSKMIKIPEVMWPYASGEVLIMEYMPGERIHNIKALTKSFALKSLAKELIRTFMHQVFHDAHFHGDLHPGNIFIDTSIPSSPQLVMIDFGIMGQLSLKDRYYLYANFQALLQHQYRRVASLHVNSGWVPSETDENDFAAYARSVIEPIAHKPIGEISLAELLSRLLAIGKKFNMKLLPELILLQKSLIHVENIVRKLDPSINVWQELRASSCTNIELYQEIFSHYLHQIPTFCLKPSTPVIKKVHWPRSLLYSGAGILLGLLLGLMVK